MMDIWIVSHFLAFANTATMKTPVWGKYISKHFYWIGVQLLGLSICICSALIDSAKQFSKIAVRIYTQARSTEGSSYSIS